MRSSFAIAMFTLAPLLLCACSNDTSADAPAGLIVQGDAVESPYDGPMTATRQGEVGGLDTGVAGLALECDGEPYRGGSVDYDVGLAEVQNSPDQALANLLDPTVLGSIEVPTRGYRRERGATGRVLLSFDVADRTRVAVVLADGMNDYLGNEGWGVEWWAQCDPAELPASVTEALEIGVWADESGERAPVTEIYSFKGAEHCAWEHITFLHVGLVDPQAQFVRDTEDQFTGFLTTTFATVDSVPNGAVDTGYDRNGRSLWLTPERDAAYLVSDDDPRDVERWPAESRPIGCA